MGQVHYTKLSAINSNGQIVRYDMELIDNGRDRQFAIATERPDSEAPLFTARREIANELKHTPNCRLSQCLYVERDPLHPNAMSAMVFEDVGGGHVRHGYVRDLLPEQDLKRWISEALHAAAPDQQTAQTEQMRNSALPVVDRDTVKTQLEPEQ